MTRTIRIVHTLHYTFSHQRFDTVAAVRLTPLNGPRQRLLHHRVRSSPTPDLLMNGVDEFGNDVAEIVWETLPELSMSVMSALELSLTGSRLEHVDPHGFEEETPSVSLDPRFAELGRSVIGNRPLDAGALFQLAQLLRSSLTYDESWSRRRRSATTALRDGSGSHADYAHIALAVFRSLGFPACYVRGYLLPPGGTGDARDHAWVAVYTDSHGWLEVDPMLGCPPDLRHIAVAVGRDRNDVTPVESFNLTAGLVRVRRSVSFYPLSRTSVPAIQLPKANEPMAS